MEQKEQHNLTQSQVESLQQALYDIKKLEDGLLVLHGMTNWQEERAAAIALMYALECTNTDNDYAFNAIYGILDSLNQLPDDLRKNEDVSSVSAN